MKRGSKKGQREKDLTGLYLSGGMDEDRVDKEQRFSDRAKHAQQEKTLRTAAKRAADDVANPADIDSLRIGQVIQVHSLFCEVLHEGTTWLCVTRKTLAKVSKTAIVVGDRVRFREGGTKDEQGRPEAAIEHVLPRETILTRTESFKGVNQHPIVANADQMLIVASVLSPEVKWGLVDRMLIAAQAGKLKPILCLNKIDLAQLPDAVAANVLRDADAVLGHYRALDIQILKTCLQDKNALDELRDLLRDKATVLAGHSGVGKSSLINAIQPQLNIRVGEISEFTDKGRHTTTSARRYPLDFGGEVIDTPGVKVFGLWGVTRENLDEFFPDVVAGTAPEWRIESHGRLAAGMKVTR